MNKIVKFIFYSLLLIGFFGKVFYFAKAENQTHSLKKQNSQVVNAESSSTLLNSETDSKSSKALSKPSHSKSSESFQSLHLEDLGFLRKDTSYYTRPILEKWDLIYSEDFKTFPSYLYDRAKKIDSVLSAVFEKGPYFRRNSILFSSSREQILDAHYVLYPLSYIMVYPSLDAYFMDESSLFDWSRDVLVHEITHSYQVAQNSALDRLLWWLFPPLFHRNLMLSPLAIEGQAVLNESIYGTGGRLFSGWGRALVFSQIQADISLRRVLKFYDDRFSGLEKYLHGGYFFAYLHSQYGEKKLAQFYSESGRFFPIDFLGLNASLDRTFNKELETLFEEYKRHYKALADNQKSSYGKAFAKSQVALPINSNKNKIYFLTSDYKSPPQLILVDKKTRRIKRQTRDLPLGKVFYRKGQYYVSSNARTSSTSLEHSLFEEGFKPVRKYNSQSVMDFFENQNIALDTRQSHKQNSLVLNGFFYDNTHSSAIMNHKGDIYYFKQNEDTRTLYKNKKALISFKSHYGYPVEVDKTGIYFIGATEYGSSLFVYKESSGRIFRLSDSDTIVQARKIEGNEFVVAEVTASHYAYKVIQTKEISGKPVVYKYSFTKKNIFKELSEVDDSEENLKKLSESSDLNKPFKQLSESSFAHKDLKELNKPSDSRGGLEKESKDNEPSVHSVEEPLEEKLSFSDLKDKKEKHFEDLEKETGLMFFQKKPRREVSSDKETHPQHISSPTADKPTDEKSKPSSADLEEVFEQESQKEGVLSENESLDEASEEILEEESKQSLKNFFHNKPKPYKALTHLSLQQASFMASVGPLRKPDFFSLVTFTDPLQFNELAFTSIFNIKQKTFELLYIFNKYRPSLSFFANYEEGWLNGKLDRYRIQTLYDIGFLEKEDVYVPYDIDFNENGTSLLKSKVWIPYRDRSLGLGLTYPLIRTHYWDLLWTNQFTFGQKQFGNADLSFPDTFPFLFYKDKAWKNYFEHKGELSYEFERKYPYAYSFYKKRNLKGSYNILNLPQEPLYFSWELFAGLTEEFGKEWFLSLGGHIKQGLWGRSPQALIFQEEQGFFYSFFRRGFKHLYKFDFQALKVLNHSFYPLKWPFALRRWAPVIGFSFLSFKEVNKKYKYLLIPSLGLESEVMILWQKSPFKLGFTGHYVIDLLDFNPKSAFQMSFWLKGRF